MLLPRPLLKNGAKSGKIHLKFEVSPDLKVYSSLEIKILFLLIGEIQE